MLKNTLYITFDGLSDPLGQSQILPYLCGIAKNGYQINILSCEKEERLKTEEAQIRQVLTAAGINWQYIIYDESGGSFSRINYIRKIKNLADTLCKKENISLVHCRSYLASLIGLSLKRKRGIPYIFDMRGFWADERIDGGIWKRSNFIQNFFYSYFKKKEKQFVEYADAVVSLTKAGLIELKKQYSGLNLEAKTTIIPCCTNTDLFDPQKIKPENILPELNSEDHVLIYTGSIGTWYYTKEIIDCVLVWKKKIPKLKLLILTKDRTELEKILNVYSKEDRANVISAGASYQDVAKYLALARAAIFFIKPAYSKIASSPTKMAECWAMNLPIITNAGIGDNDLYFENSKGGLLLHDFTTEEYQKTCENYLQLIKKPADYRTLALADFDTKIAVERYSSLYEKYSK